MKGVILAGGKGTRLLPATKVVNKHMVPILNRPMITYPLLTLVNMGIKDIMIVSGGGHIGGIADFLGDGESFGVSLTYRVQREAGGIAQALGCARDFVGDDAVMVILGDNVFDNGYLKENSGLEGIEVYGAHVFVKQVPDPQRFGVVRFKREGDRLTNEVEEIIEKPKEFVSDYAVTGLYAYPRGVFDVIKDLKPSARGELEITDVNNYYAKSGELVAHLYEGFWSDAGTPDSLYEVTKWVYESGRA